MVGVEFDYVVVGAGGGRVRGGRAAGGGRAPRQRAAHRVRRARRQPAAAHPEGVLLHAPRRPVPLPVPDAPGHAGRRGRGLAARPGARRVGGGERDDVDARRAGRLGRPGGARQSRLVLGGRAARVQGDGESQPRPLATPRRRRPARRLGRRRRRPGDQRHPRLGRQATAGTTSTTPTRPTPSGSPSPRPRSGDGRRTTSYDAFVRPALGRRPPRGPPQPHRRHPHPGRPPALRRPPLPRRAGHRSAAGARGTSRPAGR